MDDACFGTTDATLMVEVDELMIVELYDEVVDEEVEILVVELLSEMVSEEAFV